MNIDQLIATYPRLYHSTAAQNSSAIARHGLWTTAQIVTTAGLDPAAARAMLQVPRPRPVHLEHPILGATSIRDQAPLRPHVLTRCLTDLTVIQWLSLLNDRAFFWLHPSRLNTLLSSRRNRGTHHDVFTIDTCSLLDVHHGRIRLSPINSGAALYPNAAARGSATFMTIEDYPFAERRRTRPVRGAIAELAVIGGVADLAAHAVDVQHWDAMSAKPTRC